MRYLPRTFRNIFLITALMLACRLLTSCGTTCFAGVINPSSGTAITSPPSVCPYSPGMTTMNITVAKSQVCETCTASIQPQHIFVTLTSIQLHSVFPESPSNPEWLELAPQLLRKPRQIDLLSDPTPEILVQGTSVPAGTYDELLLQFSPDTDAHTGSAANENPCGQNRANCMIMADGHIEDLQFTADSASPQLSLPLQFNGTSALALVPGATVDLRLTLQPQQISAASPTQGWQIHYVLVGTATASR
jgi:hypothetical protein